MNIKTTLLFIAIFSAIHFSANAQIAPNIDFESAGNANWVYLRGTNTSPGPVWTLATCPPDPTLHMVTSGSGVDYYSGLPIVGDGAHSLRLGKDTSNTNADAADY